MTGEVDRYITRKAQNIFSRRESTIDENIDMFFDELLQYSTGEKRTEANIHQLIDRVCAGWIDFGDYIEGKLGEKIEEVFQERADEGKVVQQDARAARADKKRKMAARKRSHKF